MLIKRLVQSVLREEAQSPVGLKPQRPQRHEFVLRKGVGGGGRKVRYRFESRMFSDIISVFFHRGEVGMNQRRYTQCQHRVRFRSRSGRVGNSSHRSSRGASPRRSLTPSGCLRVTTDAIDTADTERGLFGIRTESSRIDYRIVT